MRVGGLTGSRERDKELEQQIIVLQYVTAEQLSGKEVEPKLLYALLLLKGKMRDEAAQRVLAGLEQ